MSDLEEINSKVQQLSQPQISFVQSNSESQQSSVNAAFPLDQLDPQQQVFAYLQNVKTITLEAQINSQNRNNKVTFEPQTINQNNKQNIEVPKLSKQQTQWQQQVLSHFQVIKHNITYLKAHQKHKPVIPSLKHIYEQSPEIQKLLKLIELISRQSLISENWQSHSYNVCLWLYSLLALFRVGGGQKYDQILGGINTIVQRDKSVGSRVLKVLLIKEFGQIHIK